MNEGRPCGRIIGTWCSVHDKPWLGDGCEDNPYPKAHQ